MDRTSPDPSKRHPDRSGSGGFTLLEVTVALALLGVIGAAFSAMLVGSRRTTGYGRERVVAGLAIRDYVAAMRGKTAGQVFLDTTTPADYFPSGTALRQAVGEVFKIDRENGQHGAQVVGATGSATTNNPRTFPDGSLLAFPRDLDGNGVVTSGSSPPTNIIALPARVTLSWTSELGGTQSVVSYVVFANP